MKSKCSILIAGCFGLNLAAYGQLVETHNFTGLNIAIPDSAPENEFGTSDSRTITSDISEIGSIRVTLSLSSEYNGDLFVALSHNGVTSVLINRTGRRSDSGEASFGYGDKGFNVTFDDAASNGDIHNYRLTLTGSHDTALPGPLTGTWAPDGRTADPSAVLESDSRTALLGLFNGMNANGTWTLILGDAVADNPGVVTGWGIEITPVPEPSAYLWSFGILSLGFAAARRFRAS